MSQVPRISRLTLGLSAVVAILVSALAIAAHHNDKPLNKDAKTLTDSKKTVMVNPENAKTVIFAGGCFWCMEPPYDKLEGVIDTVSGYSGGQTDNPTYRQISRGGTGHYEVVRVTYDPNVVGFDTLLNVFWKNIDPFDDKGQFCDKGQHYTSAIFYENPTEKALAEQSLNATQEALMEVHGQEAEIRTKILPATTFFAAEDYHQDYYQKNPIRYKGYRYGCGRDSRLKAVWSKVTL